MSGETSAHTVLVERLISYVRARHCPPRGLLVLADHHTYGNNRPPQIAGYTPDLFASDLPATFEVIGEAKTMADLETGRSHRQISAFLDYLSVRQGSSFYLVVPPFQRRRSAAIVDGLRTPAHSGIAVEVIDGL
ncbi:hypothetical protein [Aliirhizobium smilacinae]|uniref:Uncharacterized protein n=1 Tax=Aliirhizobium smilacinae TaxID=1395944 RepID=A0A5C4X8R2_9HYPH|nr:hypothetical protein [Rhizobium smilacinae]TNM59865.1 hypothetical protein FHP24_27220 [Rhizobium smilacinae]